MRRLLLAGLASILVFGCQQKTHAISGSRSASFGRAELMTALVEHRPTGRVVPLVHVLFVPDWDLAPGSGYGGGRSSGGTVDRWSFVRTFIEDGREVKAQPIEVLNAETVQAAGRTWDLRAGNVFVALVNPDGTLRVTQLSTNETSPEGVLASIKQALPAEPRVQALEAKR